MLTKAELGAEIRATREALLVVARSELEARGLRIPLVIGA